MKISMVSEHASPLAMLGGVDSGGQNVHVAQLSAALAARGHTVTVYTRRSDESTPDSVRLCRGVDVVHVPAGPPEPLPKDDLLPHMGDFARWLAERWRDPSHVPDVVHAHFWMSGLASLLSARGTGIPVVQTFHALGAVKRRHQGDADTSPAERVSLERTIARSANRVIATCSDEVFELVRMGLARRSISVVPSGVDPEQFSPHGPAAPRHARHRIVSVGRLIPRKGFGVAIRALPSLPETELVIAGGPQAGELDANPEARRLSGLAEQFRVADRVRLLGQVSHSDMPGLLRSADTVVCTPWYEPFGIVPLEAMCCQVPVVAATVGGLTDTIVDGVTGRLVPPRQPGALASALRPLLAEPATRQAYGVAGRDRATSRYTWERIAGETERIYQRTIAASATGRAASPAASGTP